MASLIKSQIIKPFLQFTKNLSADQINLSIVKGEAHLDTLELNEVALMELLGLPTWLSLRKAQCSGISFKIRWTKLNTHPVCVVIDQVDVEIEALEFPRPEVDSVVASYRIGSGKYRLADRVVDGASVSINTVSIRFCAKAFEATAEVSRLNLVSKTPTWQTGSLKLTSLSFPNADAVLIFKELSWDSARFVADGLLNELNGIPVKLITNTGRIRVTLKKRLSDSALISSRMQLFLDDILWILTSSQVEAAIVFARSLQRSIFLAARQSKQFAASRVKRQTLSWKHGTNHSDTSARAQKAEKKDLHSSAARIFHRYDVIETSYHMTLYRTEVHFCDEAQNDTRLSAVPNGYIKVHFNGIELDWYPYHLNIMAQASWHGSHEFRDARAAWLKSLNPVHLTHLSLEDSNSVNGDDATSPSEAQSDSEMGNSDPSILQSVVVFRICDLDVSLISLPNATTDSSSHEQQRTRVKQCHHYGEEIPANTGLFIGSDKKLHCLPDSVYFLTVQLDNVYRSCPSQQHLSGTETDVLPCLLFAQLKPFYVRFDADTVIWLNMFLLTLHLNLSILMRQTLLLAKEDEPPEPKSYHLRCEALMPRLLLPLCSGNANSPDRLPSTLPGPGMLVLQADNLFIQLLVPPITSYTASILRGLLSEQPSDLSFPNTIQPNGGRSHVPLDVNSFTYLVFSARSNQASLQKSDSTNFWCLHCPHVWAQFLTVVEVFESPPSRRSPLTRSRWSVYRQSFLEPIPLSLWVVQRDPLPDRPPLNILVDVDCSLNPLDSSSSRRPLTTVPTDTDDGIRICLGALPTMGRANTWIPVSYSRLPDTLDHLLLLNHLLNQLMEVKDQLDVDILRILMTDTDVTRFKDTSVKWFFTLSFRVRRAIEVQIVGLETNDPPDDSPLSCDFQLSKLEPPTDLRDDSLTPPCDLLQEGSLQTVTELTPRMSVHTRDSVTESNSHRDDPIDRSYSCDQFKVIPSTNSTQPNRLSPKPSLKKNQSDLSSSISSGSDSGLFKSTKDSETTSIAESQEDWLNTYEMLLAMEDNNSIDFDTLSLGSQNEQRTPANQTARALSVEEIGLELSDGPSTYSCSRQRTEEVILRQKTPTKVSSGESGEAKLKVLPPRVTVRLQGLYGIADACDTELRVWVNLDSVNTFSVDHLEDDVPIARSRLGTLADSGTGQPLWSVFLSTTKDTSRSSYQNPSWDSSFSISADLLQTWSLQVTSTLQCVLKNLATEFFKRLNGSVRLFETTPTCATPRIVQLPLPVVDIRINLKGGTMELDMQPEEVTITGDENQFFRKIRLQQGLSICLDRDALFRIGFDTHNAHPAAVRKHLSGLRTDASSFESPSGEIPSAHHILLSQYSAENKRLKDQVEKLTSQVVKLQCELDQAKHSRRLSKSANSSPKPGN